MGRAAGELGLREVWVGEGFVVGFGRGRRALTDLGVIFWGGVWG